eukprot:TRINITY_DN4915_c0_g1_i2.p1 TRINITY_DN4915_c0_g1~~TRINITY_DN4915_c0_g1_i2.p1  ORF type:complete len:555 (-),score=106.70 TRINITY_DN4915_c0_g1_i2:8-1672(-)
MKEEKENPHKVEVLWRPEYGRHMLEGTPGKPYCGALQGLEQLQKNMTLRRNAVQSFLQSHERIGSLTVFPRLGCKECTHPSHPTNGPVALSDFLPDTIINPHFRFSTLTANIRTRRGSKVDINVPMFKDTNTPAFFEQEAATSTSPGSQGRPYNIHMDAMGFGMGCCCLQCTFQCCNITEARYFYDQLAVLCPIMLALTAAAPVYRGYLADIDVRWTVISQSVDDRTRAERGEIPFYNPAPGASNEGTDPVNGWGKQRIDKSRYDSIDCYISNDAMLKPEYNDIPLVMDEHACEVLMKNGVDELLSRHIAHLFIREPLVIYGDKIEIDDSQASDHFENIQSTNWQTVRFKPPPPGSPIGWRVEFRPMEIQITDFENAAFVVFIVLLTRVISSFDLNFYIPLSKVDENMKRAHNRGAVTDERFYFRKNISKDKDDAPGQSVEDEYTTRTINEIMNGTQDGFQGLIPLMHMYLDSVSMDVESRTIVNRYLSLISKRASGELMTCASWMRHFISHHPDYKQDSVVSDSIQYDLLETIEALNAGKVQIPEMFGKETVC